MINEMLDISKVESGTVTISRQPVAIRRLIGALIDEFQLRASQKGLKFTMSLEGALPEHLETDPLRLRQVLYNLIGNAIKFTEKGEVSLGVRFEQERLHFVVRDTGPGIPAVEQDNVFKPFYQATNNRLARQGVGLGLYICQRIVQLLGGRMGLVSALGQGSVFWCELPAKTTEAVDENRALAPVIAYTGPRRRILVVDDAEANRDFLRELLAGVGFEVKAAASGEQAITLALREVFDVVICDLRMAGKDGISTCRELRALPGGDKLALIAVSASVYEDDRHQAKQAGFDDFLVKPVKEKQLFEILRKLISLEWVYAAGNPQDAQTGPAYDSVEDAARAPLVEPLPSSGELAALLGAAERGDILALRRLIEALNDPPALAAFRRRLQILIGSFRMGEVEQVLQMAQKRVDPSKT
jgi:CheY-like chemotaxis protein